MKHFGGVVCNMQNLLIGFFRFLFSMLDFLPSIEIGFIGEISNSLQYLFAFINKANFIIPVNTVLSVISAVFVTKLAFIAFFVVAWVIRRVIDVIP